MKKQIFVDTRTREFLMKTFKCTRMTVWRALNYESSSEQARKIRHLAIQAGGAIVDGYKPDCETSFEETEKTMIQKFGERVKIIVDRKSNEVSVWVDDKREGEVYTGLSVADFMQLQHETELMATSL